MTISSVFLVACGANPEDPITGSLGRTEMNQLSSPKMSSPNIDVTNLIKNPHLSELEKRSLVRLYLKGRYHPTNRPNATNTVLALAMVDAQGHIVAQFANRPDVTIAPVKGFRMSGIKPPCTGNCTGPFQQLSTSTQPIVPYNSAMAILPCPSSEPESNDPYAYLGGKTSSSSSQVESGLQWNPPSPGNSGATWQPYISLAYNDPNHPNGDRWVFPGNGNSYQLTASESGTGSTGHWLCNGQPTISVGMYFQNTVDTVFVTSPPVYYDCFINDSFEDVGGTNIGDIFWGVCPTPGYTDQAQSWNGWLSYYDAKESGGGGQCPTCTLQQTTSIAQPGGANEPNNGAIIGPVVWSAMQVDNGNYAYTYCDNWPK